MMNLTGVICSIFLVGILLLSADQLFLSGTTDGALVVGKVQLPSSLDSEIDLWTTENNDEDVEEASSNRTEEQPSVNKSSPSSSGVNNVIMPALIQGKHSEAIVKLDDICSPGSVPITTPSKKEEEANITRALCQSQSYVELVRRHYSFMRLLGKEEEDDDDYFIDPEDPVWKFRIFLIKRQLCEAKCGGENVHHFSQTSRPHAWRGLGARICHMIAGFGCALAVEGGSMVVGDARRGEQWQWAFTDLGACPAGGHGCYFQQHHMCSGSPLPFEKGKDVTMQRGMCDFKQYHQGLDRMRASSELVFYLMQPNQQMARQISNIKKYLDWDEIPKPILAMHVRHGKTKFEAFYIRFERFMEVADSMRDKNGRAFKSIFLFTDDMEVIEQVISDKELRRRWTFISIDKPKFSQKGWDDSKMSKGADAFFSIAAGSLNGCHTGALAILNMYIAGLFCEGFVGMFNSNMDRVVVRLLQARQVDGRQQLEEQQNSNKNNNKKTTGESEIIPPTYSLDAWPCGYADVVCAPQVRVPFPAAVRFAPDVAAKNPKSLATNTQRENEWWWEENFQNFTAEWNKLASVRGRVVRHSPLYTKLIGESTTTAATDDGGRARKRRKQHFSELISQLNQEDTAPSSSSASSSASSSSSPIAFEVKGEPYDRIPVRLGQILELWLLPWSNSTNSTSPPITGMGADEAKTPIRRPVIKGWNIIAAIPQNRGKPRYLLQERAVRTAVAPAPSSSSSSPPLLSLAEAASVAKISSSSLFATTAATSTSKSNGGSVEKRNEQGREILLLKMAAVAANLLNVTRVLGAHFMEGIALSEWPYPTPSTLSTTLTSSSSSSSSSSNQHPATKPLVAIYIPSREESSKMAPPPPPPEVMLEALLETCKNVGAGAAYVGGRLERHHADIWEKSLNEINVKLVMPPQFSGWKGDWHFGIVGILIDLLSMSMADVFIGDPRLVSNRFIFHAMNGRLAGLAAPEPLALKITCGGLDPLIIPATLRSRDATSADSSSSSGGGGTTGGGNRPAFESRWPLFAQKSKSDNAAVKAFNDWCELNR